MRLCSIEKCGKRHKARGYCDTHVKRFLAGRDMTKEFVSRTKGVRHIRLCAEHGCRTKSKVNGYCFKHNTDHVLGKSPDELRALTRTEYAVRHRVRKREFIIAFKQVPCMDCTTTFPTECMDFDHVRGEKKFNICTAAGAAISYDDIVAEIAKCDVVCSNCHRIRTKNRRKAPMVPRKTRMEPA